MEPIASQYVERGLLRSCGGVSSRPLRVSVVPPGRARYTFPLLSFRTDPMKFLALALALFLIPQEEKVTFKFAPKQGDKVKRNRSIEFNLNIEVEAGDEIHEVKMDQKQVEKSTIEYAAVEDGKVTRKVFEFTENYEEKKQPPMMPDWQRTDRALHGRKVTAFLKDGQLAHEGGDGLAEKELAKLQLTDVMTAAFPKDPVAIGGGWELKDEDVRKFLEADQKVKKASLKFKLTAVKEIDKRKCAVLQSTLEL